MSTLISYEESPKGTVTQNTLIIELTHKRILGSDSVSRIVFHLSEILHKNRDITG